MKIKFNLFMALFFCCMAFSAPGFAQQNCMQTPNASIFGICVMVLPYMGQTLDSRFPTVISANFSSAEEMIDQLDFRALQAGFGGNYQDPDQSPFGGATGGRSGITSTIYFRGIRMEISSPATPNANPGTTTTIRFRVPDLDVDEMFSGASRDAAVDNLEDFLEKDGGDIINRINKRLAEVSPVDPLAGNPSSLMGTMVDGAFQEGADPTATAAAEAGATRDNFFGTGVHLGRYAQGGRDVNTYTLPLRYTFDRQSGNTVSLRMPISYQDAQGAASFKLGFGVSYGRAMNERWTLTPGVEYGLVASADLVSAGQVGSFTLTSLYKFDGPRDFTIGVANMAGYYKTFPIKLNDVKIDPDIANQVVKNGVIMERKIGAGGKQAHLKAYLTDTRFFGDKLYADQYNEAGVFLTRVKDGGGGGDRLGVNVKYLFSTQSDNDVKGLSFSLSYNF